MKIKNQKRLEAIERQLPDPLSAWSALVQQVRSDQHMLAVTIDISGLRRDLAEIDRLFKLVEADGRYSPSMWVLRNHVQTADVAHIIRFMAMNLGRVAHLMSDYQRDPEHNRRCAEILTHAHEQVVTVLSKNIDNHSAYPAYAWNRHH